MRKYKDGPYLADYQKALEIFNSPDFENQELLLHDYNRDIFKTDEKYTDNGIHWGYVPSLVCQLNDIFEYTSYAIIMNKEIPPHILTNSRYVKATFKEIKPIVLKIMKRKIQEEERKEDSYQEKKREFKEYINPEPDFTSNDFLLVKYEDNWADEMNISGFKIFTKEHFDNWKEYWKECLSKETYIFGIGTNEEIEYEDSNEFFSRFTVGEISGDEAKTYYKHFGSIDEVMVHWNGRNYDGVIKIPICEFGFFPPIEIDE